MDHGCPPAVFVTTPERVAPLNPVALRDTVVVLPLTLRLTVLVAVRPFGPVRVVVLPRLPFPLL